MRKKEPDLTEEARQLLADLTRLREPLQGLAALASEIVKTIGTIESAVVQARALGTREPELAKLLQGMLPGIALAPEASDAMRVWEKEGREHADLLLKSIDELELSVRSYNSLKNNAGVLTIGDLREKTRQELLVTKNFGRRSLREVEELLAGMGLSLRPQR